MAKNRSLLRSFVQHGDGEFDKPTFLLMNKSLFIGTNQAHFGSEKTDIEITTKVVYIMAAAGRVSINDQE